MTTLATRFEIRSWDEKPYRELPDGRKFTRANVVLSVAEEGISGDATWEALMYYAADGTTTYVGLMHFTGRLGDRSGEFVTRGEGSFDGARARGDAVIVSGLGELAGLRGTSHSVSTHADYPFMPITLEYEVG